MEEMKSDCCGVDVFGVYHIDDCRDGKFPEFTQRRTFTHWECSKCHKLCRVVKEEK
jgi:hypothetical protein